MKVKMMKIIKVVIQVMGKGISRKRRRRITKEIIKLIGIVEKVAAVLVVVQGAVAVTVAIAIKK